MDSYSSRVDQCLSDGVCGSYICGIWSLAAKIFLKIWRGVLACAFKRMVLIIPLGVL